MSINGSVFSYVVCLFLKFVLEFVCSLVCFIYMSSTIFKCRLIYEYGYKFCLFNVVVGVTGFTVRYIPNGKKVFNAMI